MHFLNFYQECHNCGLLVSIMNDIPATNETRINPAHWLIKKCPACQGLHWNVLVRPAGEGTTRLEFKEELYQKCLNQFRHHQKGKIDG